MKRSKADYLREIEEGKYTLVIRKTNGRLFKSKENGIKDLILAYKKGFLKKATVYDKIVGLAAAKILVFSKVKEIYALLCSQLAFKFCQKEKIPLNSQKIVKKIYDFKNKNGCRLEKMAQKVDNLPDLIKKFEKFYEI